MLKNPSYVQLFTYTEEISRGEYMKNNLKNIKTFEEVIDYLHKDYEDVATHIHNQYLMTPDKISLVQSTSATVLANLIPFLRSKLGEQLDNLPEVLDKKNHDYGNSFDKLVNMYGDVAMSIRISDKLSRLDSLVNQNNEAQVNESVNDTLLDLAGYLLLAMHYTPEEDSWHD